MLCDTLANPVHNEFYHLMKIYPEHIPVALDPEFFWYQLLFLLNVSSAGWMDFQIQLSASQPTNKERPC